MLRILRREQIGNVATLPDADLAVARFRLPRRGSGDESARVKSPSRRGFAEKAPDARKDVERVVELAEKAGLARRVARLAPVICIER